MKQRVEILWLVKWESLTQKQKVSTEPVHITFSNISAKNVHKRHLW